MSFSRVLASILLTLSVVSAGESTLAAQSVAGGNSLIVPVTGVADLGGMFSGAFIVEHFAQQGSGIIAAGTVTGALTINGSVRNLVIQTALPLDLNASRARLNTDAALAKASTCDVLHIELGATTINVLGATLGFNPVAFDLTAATASAITSTAAAGTANTAAPQAAGASQPGGKTSSPSGTVTPFMSVNTTQATSSTPGTVPQATTATTPAPAQLRPLLCTVDGFRTVSDPAQLVQQLNAILAALGSPTMPS